MTSRREFLAGLAAAGASTLMQRGGAPTTRRAIDVHHHLVPPKVLATHREEFARVGALGGNETMTKQVLEWTPQISLELMDAAGVNTAMLSMSTPGSWFGSAQDGRKMAREINEMGATMMRDHPGRFGLMASLPLPDTEGSLKEIEYAMTALKADGIGLMTSYDTWPLGHQMFWPVYEELNRRRTIIFVHRTSATCCLNLRVGPGGLQEFLIDDLRFLNSLLTSGTLNKFPNITWIHGHGDAMLPFVAKLNGAPINGADRAGKPAWAPNGVQAELKKVYVDTGGNNKLHLDELRKLGMLATRTMYCSDVPYGRINLTNMRNPAVGLSPEEIQAIEFGTAHQLFPKYKT